MADHVYKTPKWFTDRYGLSSASLRRWEHLGHITAIRCPGGKRLYSVETVQSLLRAPDPEVVEKEKVIYARVSSAKQKEDLARQIELLQQAYPEHRVIHEIASGVNFKRKGLRTLLEQCHKGLVSEVVILHKDRLSRIAYDLLEFVLGQTGAKLVVHSPSSDPDTFGDLAEDFLAISTYFVASHHGKRSAQHRQDSAKRRKLSGAIESETYSNLSQPRPNSAT